MPLQASGPSFLSQRQSGINILHSLRLSAWPVYEKGFSLSKGEETAYLRHLSSYFTQIRQEFFTMKTQFLHSFLRSIMGPLSRPRSKILRVAVSRIILSSEASKVKLVGNLVA